MTKPNDLWNEQDMASLVGLQLPHDTTNGESRPVPATTNQALLDPEDLEGTTSDKKSPLALANNPFAKLGVVAAGTGLVIGILALFTHSMMTGEAPQPVDEAQADFPDPMVEAETPQGEEDRGQLLTDLAMGQQQADLEALAERPTAKPVEPEVNATPAFSPSPQPVVRPAPVVQRSVPSPPAPLPPRPVPSIPRPPVPSAPPAVVSTPAIDPMEQWMALSQVGSYGRQQISVEPQANEASPTQLVRAERPSIPLAINHAEEAAILQGQPIQTATLITGTQAKAQLETPLLWTESTATSSPQILVQLTEPLLTPDETIGLPAGTQLVAQVLTVDESGLVQLAVTAYRQAGADIPLPDGAIQLLGPGDTPLMAQKQYDPGPDIARMDFNIATMSGLVRAAELLNQPKSSTVITNTGGSTITQDTGEPNLLAGVLEGTFGELSEQMAERNQKALEDILNRPTVWYLPPEAEVEVYINQTVTL